MNGIRSSKNYYTYVVAPSALFFAGIAMLALISLKQPLIFVVIGCAVEGFILGLKFTSSVSFSENDITITYQQWLIKKTCTLSTNGMEIFIDRFPVNNTYTYIVVRLSDGNKNIYTIRSIDGFCASDLEKVVSTVAK